MHCRSRYTLPFAALAAVALASAGPERYFATRPPAPFASLGARQVCDSSVGLARLVTGRRDRLSIGAERYAVAEPGQRPETTWLVEVSDPAGAYLAHLVRDARTGEVMEVGARMRWTVTGPVHRMSAWEAEATGRRWLRDLSVGRERARWTLANAPEKRHHLWRVRYTSARRRVGLSIDARTGELVLFCAWPARAAEPQQVADNR